MSSVLSTATVDVLRIMARADRLLILLILKSGRQSVSDLIQAIHGDRFQKNHRSQTSQALAPMRRLGIVKRTRVKSFIFYEITDLGRDVIRMIAAIDQHKKKRDLSLMESDSDGSP